MKLDPGLSNLARGLNIGTREERARILGALQEFFDSRGYRAEFGSFQGGVLLLFAAPAEHALLRYDHDALRAHLHHRGLSGLVTDVKVRTKAIAGAPART